MKKVIFALILIAAFLAGVVSVATAATFDTTSELHNAHPVIITTVAMVVGLLSTAVVQVVAYCIVSHYEEKHYGALVAYYRSLKPLDSLDIHYSTFALDAEGEQVLVANVKFAIKRYREESITAPGTIFDIRF